MARQKKKQRDGKASKASKPAKPVESPKRLTAKQQRAMEFDAIDYGAVPNGGRTRIVRISVRGWSKLKRKEKSGLRVTIGTREIREFVDGKLVRVEKPIKLRWSELGQAYVIDGSEPHADVVARLHEVLPKVDGVTFEQHVVAGSWIIARGSVLLSVPAGVADERDAFAVGMPVMGRRGSTWRRWRNAPPLWMRHRALIDHIALAAAVPASIARVA